MAIPVAAVTAGTDGTASSSITFSDWISDQQDGDFIFVVAINDGGGSALSIDAGWTQLYLSAASVSGIRTLLYYKQRTGGTNVTAPTISGANDEWACIAWLVRDMDTSTPIDATTVVTEQSVSTTTPICPSITTATDNATIFRIVTRDGGGNPRQSNLIGDLITVTTRNENEFSATPTVSALVEYTVQKTAGATGTYTWKDVANDGGVQITLAVRNKSGGKVPVYPSSTSMSEIIDLSVAPTTTLLSALHPSPATLLGRVCALGDTTGGAVRSNTLLANATYTSQGWHGYSRSIGQTQTITTGLAGTYGSVVSITSTNFTTNLLYMQAIGATASATVDDVGAAFYFRDSAGAYVLWRPFNEFQMARPKAIVAYMPSQTFVETGGGTIDWTSIIYFGVAVPVNATQGTNASREINFWHIAKIPLVSGAATPIVLVGGTSSDPIDARDISSALKSKSNTGYTYIQGAKQQTISLPVQVGDGGTNPTYFNGSVGATEFINEATPGMYASSDTLSYRIKLGSSDSFLMGSQAVGASTQQLFTVDSLSSISGSYDFAGNIFGVKPSFISGLEVDGLSFIECDEIDAQSATFIDCSITESTSVSGAAIAFSGNSSMTNCLIDATDTSIDYHIELGTSVTSFTLSDVTFSGTPLIDKIHVKKTSGTVTITAAGSTSLVAGDITSDGATIVIVSGAQVTLTGLVSGSEVRAYVGTPISSTVIDGTESSGTSFSFSHTVGGQAGFIVIRKLGYKFIKISLTYSNSDASIPIQQQEDPWYQNP